MTKTDKAGLQQWLIRSLVDPYRMRSLAVSRNISIDVLAKTGH